MNNDQHIKSGTGTRAFRNARRGVQVVAAIAGCLVLVGVGVTAYATSRRLAKTDGGTIRAVADTPPATSRPMNRRRLICPDS